MERSLYFMKTAEPDAVFENLQWTRVKIELDDHDRDKANADIEDVLKGIKDKSKPRILLQIAYAIEQELFKPKEIDVETIQKLTAWFPRCVEIDDDDKEDDKWLKDDFKLSPDSDSDEEEEEEEEADDGDEKEEEDDAADEVPLLFPPVRWVEEEEDEEAEFKKRVAAMKKFEVAGINELKRQCDLMGCRIKQGQEKEIISGIISFFAARNFIADSEHRMAMFVEHFLARVKCYISSTCTLEDLETVKKALRSVEMRIKAEFDQVHQQLEKNTAPTNEEGNEREIATPFHLPEQEEICLTPPECEDMKTEECGIATLMNHPEQEETNMVDVSFCLTPPLWEDIKTEECAIWGSAKSFKTSIVVLVNYYVAALVFMKVNR